MACLSHVIWPHSNKYTQQTPFPNQADPPQKKIKMADKISGLNDFSGEGSINFIKTKMIQLTWLYWRHGQENLWWKRQPQEQTASEQLFAFYFPALSWICRMIIIRSGENIMVLLERIIYWISYSLVLRTQFLWKINSNWWELKKINNQIWLVKWQ